MIGDSGYYGELPVTGPAPGLCRQLLRSLCSSAPFMDSLMQVEAMLFLDSRKAGRAICPEAGFDGLSTAPLAAQAHEWSGTAE